MSAHLIADIVTVALAASIAFAAGWSAGRKSLALALFVGALTLVPALPLSAIAVMLVAFQVLGIDLVD